MPSFNLTFNSYHLWVVFYETVDAALHSLINLQCSRNIFSGEITRFVSFRCSVFLFAFYNFFFFYYFLMILPFDLSVYCFDYFSRFPLHLPSSAASLLPSAIFSYILTHLTVAVGYLSAWFVIRVRISNKFSCATIDFTAALSFAFYFLLNFLSCLLHFLIFNLLLRTSRHLHANRIPFLFW